MRMTIGFGGVVVATLLTGLAVRADAQPRSSARVLRTDTIATVARLRASAVVAIHTIGPVEANDAQVEDEDAEGLGSGVVIDNRGSILTNAHVIEGVKVIHIRTAEGADLLAQVVGVDRTVDLALIRLADARGLRPAPFGNSDRLQVGEWVVAIGNPLSLHHTVTAGIVSAKSRTLDNSGVEYIQTDAAISPGSSGGPLLNLRGEIVGITVGILSPTRQNIGLNVAIPSSIIREVLPELRTGGGEHGWLGLTAERLSAHGALSRHLRTGLIVTAITPNSPAAAAGLMVGDVVTHVSGLPASAPADIYARVRAAAIGSTVVLRLWRDDGARDVEVQTGRREP